MKKLDRLGWAEGLAFSAFGVRVGVRVNVPGVLPRLLPLLPPGWQKSRTLVAQRLYSLIVAEGSERAGLRRLHMIYVDTVRLRGARTWIWCCKRLRLTCTCTLRKRRRI